MVDQLGFAKKTEIFSGSVSEPKTLYIMLTSLYQKLPPRILRICQHMHYQWLHRKTGRQILHLTK